MEAAMSGKVILLNGASSSGKSTLAISMQAAAAEPFLHYSFDHLRGSGVLPLDRIRQGDFDWSLMRESFFDGFHRSVREFAQAGDNLLVDHIVETPIWMRSLVDLLSETDVFFVGFTAHSTNWNGERPRVEIAGPAKPDAITCWCTLMRLMTLRSVRRRRPRRMRPMSGMRGGGVNARALSTPCYARADQIAIGPALRRRRRPRA
jgi:hypothetical protein